ncbi:MAG: hypothetical protein AAGF01_13355 [Cyanobacteria bacterium P01_G01_bin.38]
MHLNLTLLPYLEPLLSVHNKFNQQPDNLCGPYWVSLLLQAYGGVSVSPVEAAIAASTGLPSTGNPTDWLPPAATSLRGAGYDTIPTLADVDACGTSIHGLIHATDQLSQGRFCLIPLQADNWEDGLSTVWTLCQTHPDWQAIPILNPHTNYLWGSKLTPPALVSYLQTKQLSPSPPDWSVGHFALLVGQLQGSQNALYALQDTYPHFGWQGLHLQPPEAIAQSLKRPLQTTQGGIALFISTEARAAVEQLVTQPGLQIKPWDNGTPIDI